MQSRKPIAKQFKKKVKEILKTIRKHGAYMTPDNTYRTPGNDWFSVWPERRGALHSAFLFSQVTTF